MELSSSQTVNVLPGRHDSIAVPYGQNELNGYLRNDSGSAGKFGTNIGAKAAAVVPLTQATHVLVRQVTAPVTSLLGNQNLVPEPGVKMDAF